VATMESSEETKVSNDVFDLVFRKARTYNAWLPKPVPDDLLRQLYETLKWGPTSANMVCVATTVFRPSASEETLLKGP